MNPFLKLRINKAINNACDLLMKEEYANTKDKEFKDVTALAVKNRLEGKHIIYQQGKIIVTDIGFITMALLSAHAIYKKDCLLVPGVDDSNQFGFLVLRAGCVPYHSLKQSMDEASADAELSHQKSCRLVSFYGSKKALKDTAQKAPWYFMSKLIDAEDAGLCQWGVNSFLKRIQIGFLLKQLGAPRFILRMAGAYGDRITAATIMRKALHAESNKNALDSKKVSPLH